MVTPDAIDPSLPFGNQFCCDAQRIIPTTNVVGCDPRAEGAYETSRVHHSARRRGGRLAPRGARAAADANNWVPQPYIGRH
jgi:hypothetical protein